MNRTHVHFIFLAAFAVIFPGFASAGAAADADEAPLVVYCYDSFPAEWGPGPAIAEAFAAETGIIVEFRAPGDAVTVMNQLILEGGDTDADVVVGLDDGLLERVLEADILEPYDSPALAVIPEELVFDESLTLLPFDYGHFAICYDSQVLPDPPASLEDLTGEEYEDSLVLIDPRTSTPGLGFLNWTVAAYGEEWPEYWKRLKPSVLTITDGWSQAYSLFTAGEVPMVLSYGTSPAYHAMWEDTHRYLAAEFSDGHLMQIEAMGIVKGTDRREAAEAFVDFMLSEEAQETLALTNIMLPVNPAASLPEAYEYVLRPSAVLEMPDGSRGEEASSALLEQWMEIYAE